MPSSFIPSRICSPQCSLPASRPVINDFLYGFLLGAQAVNPDIKVDTRYTNSYVDPAKGKELAESMINDNNCDIIWGVAGNSGNGAVEARRWQLLRLQHLPFP